MSVKNDCLFNGTYSYSIMQHLAIKLDIERCVFCFILIFFLNYVYMKVATLSEQEISFLIKVETKNKCL